MPAQTRKTPQDRKPKEAAPGTFSVGSKTYTLPSAVDAVKNMSGRDMREIFMGGQQGELTVGFRLLEASDPDPELLDALYDLPASECLKILGDWMKGASMDGTTLPQS